MRYNIIRLQIVSSFFIAYISTDAVKKTSKHNFHFNHSHNKKKRHSRTSHCSGLDQRALKGRRPREDIGYLSLKAYTVCKQAVASRGTSPFLAVLGC